MEIGVRETAVVGHAQRQLPSQLVSGLVDGLCPFFIIFFIKFILKTLKRRVLVGFDYDGKGTHRRLYHISVMVNTGDMAKTPTFSPGTSLVWVKTDRIVKSV